MERMGPEALMVKSEMDFRAELAEIARSDYRILDVRALDARYPMEVAYLPATRPPVQRLLRWLRREGGRANGRPLAAAPVAAMLPEGRAVRATGLAAMPAAMGSAAPARPATQLSGMPLTP
jgi:hypothetical protein